MSSIWLYLCVQINTHVRRRTAKHGAWWEHAISTQQEGRKPLWLAGCAKTKDFVILSSSVSDCGGWIKSRRSRSWHQAAKIHTTSSWYADKKITKCKMCFWLFIFVFRFSKQQKKVPIVHWELQACPLMLWLFTALTICEAAADIHISVSHWPLVALEAGASAFLLSSG